MTNNPKYSSEELIELIRSEEATVRKIRVESDLLALEAYLGVSNSANNGAAIEPMTGPWIYEDLVAFKEPTRITIEPALRDSWTLAMLLAAHGALGLDFLGHKLHGGAFKSVIYDADDSKTTQTKYLAEICEAYGFIFEDVSERIRILDKTEFDNIGLKLAYAEEGKSKPNLSQIRKLIEIASAPDVGLISFSSVSAIHSLDDKCDKDMNTVMAILRVIALKANVGIVLLDYQEPEPYDEVYVYNRYIEELCGSAIPLRDLHKRFNGTRNATST